MTGRQVEGKMRELGWWGKGDKSKERYGGRATRHLSVA